MSKAITNVALIPARGGSKGLPKKNILPFNGKPLIAWTIEQALDSALIDRVIVSTDCRQIAEIALKYGAEVENLRPFEISTDEASTEDVMLYESKVLLKNRIRPKNLILLQCTSPIRLPGTIDRALEEYTEADADSLLSVMKCHRFFWFKDTNIVSSYNYKFRPRRQDIQNNKVPYMETGSIYITDFEMFLQEKNRLLGRIHLFETSYYESFEIDDKEDFVLCEFLAKKVLKNDNL